MLPRLHVPPLEHLTRDEHDSLEFFDTPGRAEKARMWFAGQNPYTLGRVKVDSAHWRKIGSEYALSRWLHVLRDYPRFVALHAEVVARQKRHADGVAELEVLWGVIVRDTQKRILALPIGSLERIIFREIEYGPIPTIAVRDVRLLLGHACCRCDAIFEPPQFARPGAAVYWECACSAGERAEQIREFSWVDIE